MLVKAKTTATVTVIRSRFFSTTVDPAAAEPTEPPNMSDRPPPLPECLERIQQTEAASFADFVHYYAEDRESGEAHNYFCNGGVF